MQEDSKQLTFDKFMDDILVREDKSRKKNRQKEDTPSQEYNRKYRERSGNRIKFGGR